MAKITPCFENGKAAHVGELPHKYAFGSTEFHVLRPGPMIDAKYLYRFLQAPEFRNRGKRRMTGSAGQQRVPTDFLKNESIPLPPLPEQKRIAAILDKADAIRRKREQAIKLADEFLRSLFLDMFVHSAERGRWQSNTIGGAVTAMRTGPFGSQLLHSEFVDSGVAVLGIDNAVQNTFAWAKPRFITSAKYNQLKRYTVHPGDVLITIMGTCGRVAIVPEDIGLAINTKHLCCLTPDPALLLSVYLHATLLYDPKIRTCLGASQRGAIMNGLNMQTVKELPLTLPPLEIQQHYLRCTSKFRKARTAAEESLAACNDLQSSLTQRAFSGEL